MTGLSAAGSGFVTGNRQVAATRAQDREIERLEWLVAAGHPWLRFPRDLEREFGDSQADLLLGYRRLVLLAAFLVLLLAGLLDWLVVKRDPTEVFLLRYGLAVPVGALFIAWSRSRGFRRSQQWVLCLFTLLLAGLMFGLMLLGDEHVIAIYLPGFLLIAVFAGMLLWLNFWLSTALLAVIGAAYLFFLLQVRPQAPEIVIPHMLFYATASLIALFANYHIEHAARARFLQVRLLALKQAELETANQRLQELADQDGLTGVANRRHFDAHLQSEWNRARRSGRPLSLLLIDLDFFKKYNDTYGHQAGDDCLIVVGAVLRAHAQRPGDLAARYGGEEFALVMPDTEAGDAEEIAWRIVHDLAAYRIPHRTSGVADFVTASAGVASCIASPVLSPRELLAAADDALYQAKRTGRNRVSRAAVSPGETPGPSADPAPAGAPPAGNESGGSGLPEG